MEAAVHVVQDVFQHDETEAALLLDATNAFNTLNRATALHNIRFICPSLSTILVNIYKAPTQLFIDGESLLSQEGTTQGDPLTIQMYTLATVPLIRRLPDSVTQVWYADDATALHSYDYCGMPFQRMQEIWLRCQPNEDMAGDLESFSCQSCYASS